MTDALPDLPAALRQRAAQLLDGTLDVVALRDAATVALLRDGRDGLEVFMQRRTSTLAFASGMYVFPGGRVEQQDNDPAIAFLDEPPEPVPFATGGDIVLGLPGPPDPVPVYRALIVAAVRETLEEAGVLLAHSDDGPVGTAQAQRVRQAILGGTPLGPALAAAGVALSFGSLVAFSHWMTPAAEVRRFDTRFFAALLPPGQEATSASGESDEAGWVRPEQMLQRGADGDVVMLPPTIAALRLLAAEPSAARAVAAGHRPGIRPLLPHPVAVDGPAGFEWRVMDGYSGLPWGTRE